ncbi:hypothetical protein ACFL1X_10755 [Candidatus Hydrogenedentota bacterium]
MGNEVEDDTARLLREHALFATQRARDLLGSVLSTDNLERFLKESLCLRYPTEIVFTRSELEPHQFAQPFFSGEGEGRTCELRIDPSFDQRPDDLPWLVAYMAAAINYGGQATPELCEIAGAELMGVSQESFYTKICDLADNTSA